MAPSTVSTTAFRFETKPKGSFDLDNQAARFGGWPKLGDAIVMAFPVEGWPGSAAVLVRHQNGNVTGEVHGISDQAVAERAWHQAMAALSLDIDGTGFAEVGRRDPVIGRLQAEYHNLRPVLFHSPYEAACSFLIGHRISILQTRRIRQRMAEELGVPFSIEGQTFYAFPEPQALLRLDSFPGITPVKTERLHGAARAALNGTLQRDRLRALPEADALALLRTLDGVGTFFAQGILMRGAGLVDAVTDDDLTARAVQLLYGLKQLPDYDALLERAEAWRPYRMWAVVLLNVWVRSQPPEVIGRRRIRQRAS